MNKIKDSSFNNIHNTNQINNNQDLHHKLSNRGTKAHSLDLEQIQMTPVKDNPWGPPSLIYLHSRNNNTKLSAHKKNLKPCLFLAS